MLKPYISIKAPIMSMATVLSALIHRESQVRYGRLQIGYLWAFIEPFIFISVFALIFGFRGGKISLLPPEIPLVIFLTTGFLPFFLFRDVFTRTMSAIRPNAQLLYFPQVHVFELCLARAMVETINSFIVFTIFMVLLSLLNFYDIRIEEPLRLLKCSFFLILLGFGGGSIAGSLLLLFPSIEFLTQAIIIRPLMILSGVVFTVNKIPEEFRYYVLLNPIINLIEEFRSAFFVEYESIYVDFNYVIVFTMVILFLGLLTQRVFRRYAFRKGL